MNNFIVGQVTPDVSFDQANPRRWTVKCWEGAERIGVDDCSPEIRNFYFVWHVDHDWGWVYLVLW